MGRYVERFVLQFNLLSFLDSTFICKLFLKEASKLRFNDLKTYSVIQDADEYYCKVHQVVLSAIKSLVGTTFNKELVKDILFKYLKIHIATLQLWG